MELSSDDSIGKQVLDTRSVREEESADQKCTWKTDLEKKCEW